MPSVVSTRIKKIFANNLQPCHEQLALVLHKAIKKKKPRTDRQHVLVKKIIFNLSLRPHSRIQAILALQTFATKIKMSGKMKSGKDKNKRKNDTSISNNSLLPEGKISKTGETIQPVKSPPSATSNSTSTPNSSANESFFSDATFMEYSGVEQNYDANAIDSYLKKWNFTEEHAIASTSFNMNEMKNVIEKNFPTYDDNNNYPTTSKPEKRLQAMGPKIEFDSSRSLRRQTPYNKHRSRQGEIFFSFFEHMVSSRILPVSGKNQSNAMSIDAEPTYRMALYFAKYPDELMEEKFTNIIRNVIRLGMVKLDDERQAHPELLIPNVNLTSLWLQYGHFVIGCADEKQECGLRTTLKITDGLLLGYPSKSCMETSEKSKCHQPTWSMLQTP